MPLESCAPQVAGRSLTSAVGGAARLTEVTVPPSRWGGSGSVAQLIEPKSTSVSPVRRLRGTTAVVIGDHRQSLAVARSLRGAGYRVIAGRAGGPTFLDRSRSVAEVWDHPPVSDPRALSDALQTLCARREDIGIVFPVGEREIELVAPLAERLPVLVVAVAPAILAICRSKRALLALAAEVGVPTEPWQTVDTPGALDPALQRVGLPAVLKPDGYPGETLGFKAAIIESAAAGRRLAGTLVFSPCGFVVQHLARGVRHNVYFVARDGRLRGFVQVRILRTDRRDGTGLAVEGVSVPPSPALLAWSEALVARLSYSGAGCAQFMVDEATGATSFLEINARLGANCAAAGACGLDLPRLFVESLLGVAAEDVRPKLGRHYAWLVGDLSGLAYSIRNGDLTWTQAVAWLLQTTRSQIQARDHVTWKWRDPLPTFVMFAGLLRTVLGFLGRRLGDMFRLEHSARKRESIPK